MKKKILIITLMIYVFFAHIDEAQTMSYDCLKEDKDKLIELAKVINVDFYEENGSINARVNNIYKYFFIVDQANNKTYKGFDFDKIIIKDVGDKKKINLSIYSDMSSCNKEKILNIEVPVPIANKFYEHDVCKNINMHLFCDKYYDNNLNESQFVQLVNQYKKKYIINEYRYNELSTTEVILEFLSNYYLIITIPLILFCTMGIILLNIKESKSKKL